MMRWLLLVSLLHAIQAQAGKDIIKVGMLDDQVPYSDFNILHSAEGALPELISLLSSKEQIQFIPIPASGLPDLEQMLLTKKVKMVLPPPFSIPPSGVLVSHTLIKQRWSLITRSQRLPTGSAQALNLNKKRILLLHSSPVGPVLTKIWPEVVLESYRLSEALKLLTAGAADGIVCDTVLADMLSHNLYSGTLHSQVLPGISSVQALWLPSGEETLLQFVNARIDSLSPGIISSVITRWLLHSALNDINPDNDINDEIIDSIAVISSILLLFISTFLLSQILLRRRAELGLQDALTYWQTLLNSIPTPLIVCNPVGIITHCNQSLQTSLQLSAEQVIGSRLEEFMIYNSMIPPVEHHELVGVISSRMPSFTDRTINIQGQTHEIVQWHAVYCNSRNVPQGLLIGWYDISERKRLERALEVSTQEALNANRAKSDFLARMSHEIRSPMNAILGLLELEKNKQHHDADSSLNIDVAYMASHQLLKIIGDVLDISKIEAGELKLHLQNYNLEELITQVLDTYTALADQKGIELQSILDTKPECYYHMDGTKLNQVLSNLLSNAIKYTDNGTVSLNVIIEPVTPLTDKLTFEVKDNGPGIPEELQKDILKPYIQLDPNAPSSTGLGLAICSQFLNLMGSSLRIESSPGEGSIFSFSLLLEPIKKIEKQECQDIFNVPKSPLHILVVDDQSANLLVIKLQLEKLGHFVKTCNDSRQVLSHLKKSPYDLLITDCQMPEITGHELAHSIRVLESEEGGYLPIIGSTAGAFYDEQINCLESGMDAVLMKPITLEDLRLMLAEQQEMNLNMEEIFSMGVGQPYVITAIIDELHRSCEYDRKQLINLTIEQHAQYRTIIHRQKGSFSLAGFIPGIILCEKIEKMITEEDWDSFRLYHLQLNALTLRFIHLLSTQSQMLEQSNNTVKQPNHPGEH